MTDSSTAYQNFHNDFEHDRMAHAYLLSSPKGEAGYNELTKMAELFLCQQPIGRQPCKTCKSCVLLDNLSNPDLITLSGREQNIGIDSIREVIESCQLTSHTGRRVILIHPLESVAPSALHTLLKTLEEPPKNHLFLLSTHQMASIPITIRSRCARLTMTAVKLDSFKQQLSNSSLTDIQVKQLFELTQGESSEANEMLENDGFNDFAMVLEWVLQTVSSQIPTSQRLEVIKLSPNDFIPYIICIVTLCIYTANNVGSESLPNDLKQYLTANAHDLLEPLHQFLQHLYQLKKRVCIEKVSLNNESLIESTLSSMNKVLSQVRQAHA